MKLDYCPQHVGAKDTTLTCYRLRHDDGRTVTAAEAMAEISALRDENAKLRALLYDAAPLAGPNSAEGLQWMLDVRAALAAPANA
jgi:hypothetical protein